jgi:hypothetical protein
MPTTIEVSQSSTQEDTMMPSKISESKETLKHCRAMELDTENKNPGIYDGLGCCYQAIEDYDQALHVTYHL